MAFTTRTALACAALFVAGCGSDPSGTGTGAAGAAGQGGTGAGSTSSDARGAGGGGAGSTAGSGTGGSSPGGYEGFGAVTQGAASSPDGFEEFHVTTLADAGPGSLRDGLSQGKRHIVFDLGGTITLESSLYIEASYLTVDGASAPAPGITIVQASAAIVTAIEASGSVGPVHDVIIHHLRMDGQATTHDNNGDIWGIDGEAATVSAVIIDHVTGIASHDGVLDIWGDVHDVTLSNNLVIDTVTALHLSTGDLAQTRERISVAKNVFAGNNERQIRLRHASGPIDYVNNVVYGWGWFEGGAAGLHIAYDAGEVNPSLNVEANVFHFVEGLSGAADDAIIWERGPDEGQVWFADNVLPSGEGDAMGAAAPLSIPAEAQIAKHPAGSLGEAVVPTAGTHHPTPEETALLAEVAAAVGP